MGVKETLIQLAEKMNHQPDGINGINTTYQFDLNGTEDGLYQVVIRDGHVKFYDGAIEEPNCSLQLSDQNLLKLIAGDLNPTMAYMTGKLKIKGELSLALKLQSILKKYE